MDVFHLCRHSFCCFHMCIRICQFYFFKPNNRVLFHKQFAGVVIGTSWSGGYSAIIWCSKRRKDFPCKNLHILSKTNVACEINVAHVDDQSLLQHHLFGLCIDHAALCGITVIPCFHCSVSLFFLGQLSLCSQPSKENKGYPKTIYSVDEREISFTHPACNVICTLDCDSDCDLVSH